MTPRLLLSSCMLGSFFFGGGTQLTPPESVLKQDPAILPRCCGLRKPGELGVELGWGPPWAGPFICTGELASITWAYTGILGALYTSPAG